MEVFILVLVVAAVVYFFSSSKTRRDNAIETRVKRMVEGGVDYATFSDLYYEAAKAYAISKGAKAADDREASATVVVDGSVYFVVFIKERDGGTTITVDLMDKMVDSLMPFAKTKEQG